MSIQQITWNDLPGALRPKEEETPSLWTRIYRFVIDCIFGWIARKILLPAQGSDPTELAMNSIQTPDGAILDVHLCAPHDGPRNKIALCFSQNNAVLSEDCLLHREFDPNIQTCTFSYRSVGHSTGTFRKTSDLVVDGATVVAYLVKAGYKKENILFHGHSLGGAIATKVKALDPELTGDLIADRTFAKVSLVASSWLGAFGSWLIHTLDLELDVISDLPRLQGRKFITWHKEDTVIPLDASLQLAGDEDVHEITENFRNGLWAHGFPLREISQAVRDKVSQFLYTRNAPPSSLRRVADPL